MDTYNPYKHIGEVMRAVHDGLMGWARDILQRAELDVVEVYGQFPPQGQVASHLVIFPYWVGPTPKLLETGHTVSVTHPLANSGDGSVSFIPESWAQLGNALADLLAMLFPAAGPPQVGNKRSPYPHPALSDLPKPLQEWYRSQEPTEDGERWIVHWAGEPHARPPALKWHPGFTLTVRYIAVASDPGRGTSQHTSVGAPLALPALSVLATGIHRERTLTVSLPPAPLPEQLETFFEALQASLPEEQVEDLRKALDRVRSEEEHRVALLPVQDLSNHEFALLMQSLQRPLQAALNLQIRLTLGDCPLFAPSTFPMVSAPRPNDEGLGTRRGKKS